MSHQTSTPLNFRQRIGIIFPLGKRRTDRMSSAVMASVGRIKRQGTQPLNEETDSVEKITHIPFTSNNTVTPVLDGKSTFIPAQSDGNVEDRDRE